MAHDVFISHSSQDKTLADAVCAALERAEIRCWIAPRDVQPGRSFSGEITRAIQRSEVMVLIFSAHSNASEQVLREVQLAANAHLHILQFRIEDVVPNDDLEYYLSTPHWLDAMTPPLEDHLGRLIISIKALISKPGAEGAVQTPPVKVPLPQKAARNFWLPSIVGIFLLCAMVMGAFLLRPHVQMKSSVAVEPPNALTNQSSLNTGGHEQGAHPTPSAKGALVLRYNFDTASPIVRPLFDSNVMSIRNENHSAKLTGSSPGILPAMFDTVLVDDFIVECGMGSNGIPPGARYGFIFRAAEVKAGGIARYFASLLDPDLNKIAMMWWMDGRWMMNRDQPVPAGLIGNGRKNRITLEAVGSRFRTFIDGRFAAEFLVEGMKAGRIGLCLSSPGAEPWTVSFDDFALFRVPQTKPAQADGNPTSPRSVATARKPFQQSWDFSAGMLRDFQSDRVEIVDARIWKMAGGKHLRFLTGGRSWLETTFDVPTDAAPPDRMIVRHLSSAVSDTQAGFSPVRITVNGSEVFRGTPLHSGWSEDEIDLRDSARSGSNTLRWDFLDGATTHYWLKSFRLVRSAKEL